MTTITTRIGELFEACLFVATAAVFASPLLALI
jgi:hypothetical protein